MRASVTPIISEFKTGRTYRRNNLFQPKRYSYVFGVLMVVISEDVQQQTVGNANREQ